MVLNIITRIKVVVEAETLAHVVKLGLLPHLRLGELLPAPAATLGRVENLVGTDVMLHHGFYRLVHVHETVFLPVDNLTCR